MIKLFKRWWAYTTARLTGRFEENADPKVQLEQAITEAQDQHRRLKEQAANVIANQKQTEMRLSRTLEELELDARRAEIPLRVPRGPSIDGAEDQRRQELPERPEHQPTGAEPPAGSTGVAGGATLRSKSR